MTWLLAIGEILLVLYLIVEVICVFTYRRRLRKLVTLDLTSKRHEDDIKDCADKRQAFFEGYRYLLNLLPDDFFKPAHRLKLSRQLDTLIDSNPIDGTPPEQEQRDDRG